MEMSALLFVPATDEHKIQKAETLGCSGIILDLEDAVSEADKERARANAA
ncbi:MAG TPA: CoA ester lyase, partial [Alicyclobacillus sp.]|nr:CoA ester lyase [Alicyclobacillus sp.]